LDRGSLVKSAGSKIALAADTEGTVTVTTGAPVDRDLPAAERPENINDFGIWKVTTSEGTELVGFVFPNLLDLDGAPVPTALFFNGSHVAVQSNIAGVRVGDGASMFESRPHGNGLFYTVIDSGKTVGTIPLTVKAELEDNRGVSFMAETFDGTRVRLVRSPNVRIPTLIDGTTAAIPSDWKWLSLEEAKMVALASSPEAVTAGVKEADAATVVIRSTGLDSFSISGPAVEKVASTDLSYADAVFLLGGLGVTPKFAQHKLACAVGLYEPIACRIGRQIVTPDSLADELSEKVASVSDLIGSLRKDLVKEAALIRDPMAVDTVLSLGFINQENLIAFVEALPTIDEAIHKMCELLLGARVGLPDLSISALEKAIRASEEVYTGLKTLAFNKN